MGATDGRLPQTPSALHPESQESTRLVEYSEGNARMVKKAEVLAHAAEWQGLLTEFGGSVAV